MGIYKDWCGFSKRKKSELRRLEQKLEVLKKKFTAN